MRYITLFMLLVLLPFTSTAGEWQAYTYTESYSRVCRMGDYLYILKGNSLVRASVSQWEIEKELTREDGLSSTDIVDICYSEEAARLAIVYADGYIDVVHPDGSIWTITDLYSAPMAGTDKTVNSAREQEGLLFVSTAFGFLVVDLAQEVVLQTFNLGFSVNCAWAYNGDWYYSTDNCSYYCPRNGNPFSPNAWQVASEHAIDEVIVLNRGGVPQCWQLGHDQSLRRLVPTSRVSQRCTTSNYITRICRADRFILAVNSDSLILYDTRFGECPYYDHAPKPGQRRTAATSEQYAGSIGICSLAKSGNVLAFLHPTMGISADSLTFSTPYTVEPISIHDKNLVVENHQQSHQINRIFFTNNEVGMTHIQPLITGYGVMMRTSGMLTTTDAQGEKWNNYDASVVTPYVANKRFVGIADMIADPFHPSRYWFSTLEDGIIGIDHGQYLCSYNHNTSGYVLEYVESGCTRVTGLTMDADSNLWCFNEGVVKELCVLQAKDKTWHSFLLPGLEKSFGFTHLCHTSHNGNHQIWGYQHLKYQTSNVFVYDYGKNIENTSDDRFTYFKTLTPTSGIAFTPYYGRGVFEGPDGAIWLLNTSGLYIIDNPNAVFRNPGIVRTVMEDVIPTSIAIDRKNRVWVSTEGHGLFLLSSDGRTQYDHISSANSILKSDEILSLAYDSIQSNLWVVTEGQILTYHYDDEEYEVSEGFTSVAYSYPSSVIVGSRSTVNVFGLKDYSEVTIQNSQSRTLVKDTALGGLYSIDTSSFPVGRYTVIGTDAEGNRGTLLTFTVDAP
jgi:hypothetical protein